MHNPTISAELARTRIADRHAEATAARTARTPRQRSLRRGTVAVATLLAAGLGLAAPRGAANAH